MTSTQEDRLRQLMEVAAGDPPRSVTVAHLGARVRRRRSMHRSVVAVAAAAAVTGIAFGVSAVTGHGSFMPPQYASTGFRGPLILPPATGVPAYYVQRSRSAPGDAVVRDTATGAVTAAVRCPWTGSRLGAIAAAQDDAFFIDCAEAKWSVPNPDVVGTQIYRFQVTNTGAIASYGAVPGGWLPHQLGDQLTAAADGSTIALNVYLDGGSRFLVISTRTGATATWTTGPVQKGGYAPGDLSLSANGKVLTFVTGNMTAFLSSTQLRMGGAICGDVAQVSPAARGGSLRSARVLLPATALSWAQALPSFVRVSRDGSAVTVAGIGRAVSGRHYILAERISVGTGRATRLFFRGDIGSYTPTADGSTSSFGGSASTDATGQYLILSFGPRPGAGNGWLDGSRLVPLLPTDTYSPEETW
jgi:hypothetical protein